MQAVDEQYLEVDAQLGGTDQRKIIIESYVKQWDYRKSLIFIYLDFCFWLPVNALSFVVLGSTGQAKGENTPLQLRYVTELMV